MLLRIIGRPELAVEQGIGDPGVGLIHAHDDAACGEGLLFRFIGALCAGDLRGGGVGKLLNLDMLALEDFEQLDFAVGFSGIR